MSEGIRMGHFYDAIFNNKHYYAASLMSKLSINMASFIWSITLLFGWGHLDPFRFPFYKRMLDTADEKVWAGVAMVCVVLGMYRLLAQTQPKWWGGIGYMVMAAFWVYLTLALFIDFKAPIPPATAASLITTSFLGVYAFVSNPRPSANVEACRAHDQSE